jgi:hypothetical protein
MSQSGANPFSLRTVLLLVAFGIAVFVALLWMIGSGMTGGSTNNGGAHAGGKGLNGYSAMAQYLERRGFQVRRSRTKGGLENPGLLVLTPPFYTEGEELQKLVDKRRYVGPTIVVTPKWLTSKAPETNLKAKKGWVEVNGSQTPEWKGFLDYLSARIDPVVTGGGNARWQAAGAERGELPDAKAVQSGEGEALVPLVVTAQDARILAGYVNDGFYPQLEDAALQPPAAIDEDEVDEEVYPLIVVFEPDLLNNYGFSQANARFGERLIRLASGDAEVPIVFDMTQHGFGGSTNLLTLAFRPPFLAATLCLLIAAIVLGWRAFLRFGPPRRTERAIAFGKRALIANAAGLIRRTRRFHLVAEPYADNARDRLAKALALPRLPDNAATEAAIDRALASRSADPASFSNLAKRLRRSSHPSDILKSAQDLHALERTLKR